MLVALTAVSAYTIDAMMSTLLTLFDWSHSLIASPVLSLKSKQSVDISHQPLWPLRHLNFQTMSAVSGAEKFREKFAICGMAATVIIQNQGFLLLVISLDYHVCHMPSCCGYSVR